MVTRPRIVAPDVDYDVVLNDRMAGSVIPALFLRSSRTSRIVGYRRQGGSSFGALKQQ